MHMGRQMHGVRYQVRAYARHSLEQMPEMRGGGEAMTDWTSRLLKVLALFFGLIGAGYLAGYQSDGVCDLDTIFVEGLLVLIYLGGAEVKR